VELMHNAQIAHRDIKLDNILVDDKNQISLTDFGYAVCGQSPAFLKIGTVGYIAPEVFLNQRYDPFCADIFSLGVVLFNMVAGENLLDDDDGPGNPIYKQLRKGSPSAFWKLLEKRCPRVKIMSIKLRMMLSSMLHPEPEKRSKLGSIKSHSWLKGDTITPLEFSQWVGRVKNENDIVDSHVMAPGELYKFQGAWKIVSSILMGIWN
jgi:serine/threonine protein kinase